MIGQHILFVLSCQKMDYHKNVQIFINVATLLSPGCRNFGSYSAIKECMSLRRLTAANTSQYNCDLS